VGRKQDEVIVDSSFLVLQLIYYNCNGFFLLFHVKEVIDRVQPILAALALLGAGMWYLVSRVLAFLVTSLHTKREREGQVREKTERSPVRPMTPLL